MDSNYIKRNPKLIMKNSLYLFFRMFFVLFMGFYFVRLSLNILGDENYGIYNIIGSITSMFSIISMPITSSIRRFMNVQLSKGNSEQTIFSASLYLIIFLCLGIFVAYEVIGLYVVNKIIILPEGKEYISNWVFQITILNTIINFLSLPFQAFLFAKEKLGITASTEIFISVFKLVFIFFIPYIKLDYLISYSLIYLVGYIIILLFFYYYFRKKYPYLHYAIRSEKNLIKEITSFSMWNSIGSFSGIILTYGSNFLINIFGGVLYNAVYAISKQISNSINSFSTNIIKAVEPQITSAHINNDTIYQNQLTICSIKLSSLIVGFIGVVFFIKGNYLLSLWLIDVPDHAYDFSLISIVTCFFTAINLPIISLIMAKGDIKRYYLYFLSITIISMFTMYIILDLGYNIIYSMYILLIVGIVRDIFGIIELKRLVCFPIYSLIKEVIKSIISLFILLLTYFYIIEPFFSNKEFIILQLFILVLLFCVIIYLFNLNYLEKSFIKKTIKRFV